MQKQFLLAAEADRIQDLIFRSSSLREVVGGSQLLSELGAKLPKALGLDEDDIITSGGGSFYLTFDRKEDAKRFGARLAEAYRRATGGSLSVAEPVPYEGDAYGEAGKEAGRSLRQAKQQGRMIATPHIPYVAFCQSCGLGLAEAHEPRIAEQIDDDAFYLCPACRHKAAVYESERVDTFLSPFYEEVLKAMGITDEARRHEILQERPWPSTAEELARYDPRGYVAYIVADGDGMGTIFSGISEVDDARNLSSALSVVTRQSLAAPIARLTKKLREREADGGLFIPALPLIMGGDDVFVLVPALWALDIVRELSTVFQGKMTPIANDAGVNREITMTAAVVFCKANYPYYLAHELGEDRLSDAKRVVKALAQDVGMRSAAVDFEIVLGSQIVPESPERAYRPTMRPYWLSESVPSAWGLPLETLFEWRIDLAEVPARRRARLRELLDPEHPPAPGDPAWDAEMRALVERVETVDRERFGESHPVRDAMQEFGGLQASTWRELKRTSDAEPWQGHGLLDLLRAWDWTREIDTDAVAYEGGR
jgi:hypothetical protein